MSDLRLCEDCRPDKGVVYEGRFSEGHVAVRLGHARDYRVWINGLESKDCIEALVVVRETGLGVVMTLMRDGDGKAIHCERCSGHALELYRATVRIEGTPAPSSCP